MIKVFDIYTRTFCLLLMIHLVAVSVCDDYLSNLFNKSTIEQSLDIEEDTNNDLKDKSLEFDNEYLVNSLNPFICYHTYFKQKNLSLASYHFLQIALTQSVDEILIPPPRA